MKITTIGIDLAKNVLQVHGVDAHGKVVLRKQFKRAQVAEYFVKLTPCLVGMEACGSAHHWARLLQGLGHTVKLMAPQFVKPYVKTNKHDVADAEAICEAVGRPTMRFVPIKTAEQQAILTVHRARQGFVKARTAQANQIRGLLAEFGVVLPQGIRQVLQHLPGVLDRTLPALPGSLCELLKRLHQHLQELDRQAGQLEQEIGRWHKQSESSQRLAALPGLGPLSASALVASVGDAHSFGNGRQVAAWLGVVPRQASTGGKIKLLGMSKRGDCYLRTLLIHGARSVVRQATLHPERADPWLRKLLGRRPKNVVAVALANKNARIAWALLAHGREYQRGFRSTPPPQVTAATPTAA